jgi:hypothetical protein
MQPIPADQLAELPSRKERLQAARNNCDLSVVDQASTTDGVQRLLLEAVRRAGQGEAVMVRLVLWRLHPLAFEPEGSVILETSPAFTNACAGPCIAMEVATSQAMWIGYPPLQGGAELLRHQQIMTKLLQLALTQLLEGQAQFPQYAYPPAEDEGHSKTDTIFFFP